MSFVSYAQNYEDVILNRALNGVEPGFYIDVGAWQPESDSVTKAFYDRGWSGINIEPDPAAHALLQRDRERDINLALAISDEDGEAELMLVADSNLSTLDSEVAGVHGESGFAVTPHTVRQITLLQLFEEHVPDGQDVHFLKIDVEGLEEQVLRGNDWTRNRPWIVVVEAMLPREQIENHQAWERILLDAGYSMVYADGLNRFYLAKEHSDLEATFRYPPNVFDEFILATHVAEVRRHTDEAERLNAEAERLNAEAERLNAEIARLHESARVNLLNYERLAQTERQTSEKLRRINKSLTWRLIKPFVFLRYPDYRAKQKSKLARLLGIKTAK